MRTEDKRLPTNIFSHPQGAERAEDKRSPTNVFHHFFLLPFVSEKLWTGVASAVNEVSEDKQPPDKRFSPFIHPNYHYQPRTMAKCSFSSLVISLLFQKKRHSYSATHSVALFLDSLQTGRKR